MLCRGCLLIALSLAWAQAAPSGPANATAAVDAAAHLEDAVTDAVPPSTTIGVACGARMHGRSLEDSCRSHGLLLQDQPTDAVRPLIETIVFIMTPIQA